MDQTDMALCRSSSPLDAASTVLEFLQVSKSFVDSLSDVLGQGEETVRAFDAAAASKIANLKADWLSLWGIYKGIPALIRDFVFNYFSNEKFNTENFRLVQSLEKLVSLFLARSANPETIYSEVKKLIGVSLHQNNTHGAEPGLFHSGPIREFLTELEDLIKNKKATLELIKQAQRHQVGISKFLEFLLYGASSSSESTDANDEL